MRIKCNRVQWNVIRGVIHVAALVLGVVFMMTGLYLLDVPADVHILRMFGGVWLIFWGIALLRTISALPRTSWEYLISRQIVRVRNPQVDNRNQS